jgi:hypothetical protein
LVLRIVHHATHRTDVGRIERRREEHDQQDSKIPEHWQRAPMRPRRMQANEISDGTAIALMRTQHVSLPMNAIGQADSSMGVTPMEASYQRSDQ